MARRDVLAMWATFRKFHVYLPLDEDVDVDTKALQSYPECGVPESLVDEADVQGGHGGARPPESAHVPGHSATANNPNEVTLPEDDGSKEAEQARWEEMCRRARWSPSLVPALRVRLGQLRAHAEAVADARAAADSDDEFDLGSEGEDEIEKRVPVPTLPPATGLGDGWSAEDDDRLDGLEAIFDYIARPDPDSPRKFVEQPFLAHPPSASATVDLGDSIPLDEQAARAKRNLDRTAGARNVLFRTHGEGLVDDYMVRCPHVAARTSLPCHAMPRPAALSRRLSVSLPPSPPYHSVLCPLRQNPELWEHSYPGAYVLGMGGMEFTYDRLVYLLDGRLDVNQLHDAIKPVRSYSAGPGEEERRMKRVLTLEAGAEKKADHFTQVFQRHRDLFAQAFNINQRWEVAGVRYAATLWRLSFPFPCAHDSTLPPPPTGTRRVPSLTSHSRGT